MPQLVRAAVDGGYIPLLKVSWELRVLTWSIDTYQGRSLGDTNLDKHGILSVTRLAKLWYDTNELHKVERFRYLGRVLSHNDNNVPAMRHTIKRVRAI